MQRVGPEQKSIKTKRSSSLVISPLSRMITFPQVNFTKFLTSSSLPVMKIALIIEKPEVGGVLPSLTAEVAAP